MTQMSHILALAVAMTLTTAPAVLADQPMTTTTRAPVVVEPAPPPDPGITQGDLIILGLFAALAALASN